MEIHLDFTKRSKSNKTVTICKYAPPFHQNTFVSAETRVDHYGHFCQSYQ